MISTLTLTTAAFMTNGALLNSFAALGVFVLLVLLFQKELAAAAGGKFKTLVRSLNVAILPFLMAFTLILVSKIIEVIK